MIKFPKPQGFQAPEGTKQGDYFEVLATVCAEGDDHLSLHEIDGLPVEPKNKKDKPEPKNMGERLDAGVEAMTGDPGGGAIPRQMTTPPAAGPSYG